MEVLFNILHIRDLRYDHAENRVVGQMSQLKAMKFTVRIANILNSYKRAIPHP